MDTCVTSVDNSEKKETVYEGNNKIVGNFLLVNSKVIFNGNNNILYTPNAYEKQIVLKDAIITFYRDNNVAFISGTDWGAAFQINLSLLGKNYLYIGKGSFFTPAGKISPVLCGEAGNVFIGNGSAFAEGAHLQTTDTHPIYDIDTGKLQNPGKSIFIGDHVWVAKDSKVLKGTKIGSGSIVGANSVVSGKYIHSNSIWAGNPARHIKDKIFFTLDDTTYWEVEDLLINSEWETSDYAKKANLDKEDYIFKFDENDAIAFELIETEIAKLESAQARVEYFLKLKESKNRFYLAQLPAKESWYRCVECNHFQKATDFDYLKYSSTKCEACKRGKLIKL